jgi:hypothetical protein
LKPKSKKRGSKSASFEENFTGSEKDLSDIIRANAKYFLVKPPSSDDEVLQRIADMFQDCADNHSIPTVEKLALCLGITRHDLYVWENRGDKGVVRSRMIKAAKEIIAAIDAEAVAQGKLNTVAYIFRAKNYYGLSDNVTIEHKAATPLGDSQDQSMLVNALLKQLQGQGQATIDLPSDYQPQPEQATITQAASDFRKATMIDLPSDYATGEPATIAQNSNDYPAEGQATMPSDYETPSDYQTTMQEPSSDYQPNDQATIKPLTALQKALAEELTAEGAAAADDLELGAGADDLGGGGTGRGR